MAVAATAAAAAAAGGSRGPVDRVGEPVSNQELVRQFIEFFESRDHGYDEKIAAMMADLGMRLIVTLDDLRTFNEDLAQQLMRSPFDVIPNIETAIKEIVEKHDPAYMRKLSTGGEALSTEFRKAALDRTARIHVGFDGSFGSHQVSPRGLTSELITRLVCVEGIITRCSAVRPKVSRSVHYCPETQQFETRDYRDATDPYGIPTGSVYPTRTEDGHPLETEFGLSTYRDNQIITVQEMPERAPLGQLPRSVEVILEEDLVDQVKPGDRVHIAGVFRALAGRVSSSSSGRFRTVVLASSVQLLRKQIARTAMTDEDIRNIRALAKREDVFELLSRSMAPSIYGHRFVKRALTLLLLGGVERNLPNGTHLRGDINILMVGDPSTAKSQLLRFVLNIAPLAINTTGRGSSGVGLTAAVATDADTGDRRLEAGAMVLADRGVVCIDEFDKMSDADRVAIHEVMEQQTVTIAKAGIQASLNARCSVVAAANPVYGKYRADISPQRNVNLPDSLLSRFDLLFIVLDTLDARRDTIIADHVLRLHRYERPGQEGRPVPLDAGALDEDGSGPGDAGDDEDGTSRVFVKFNPLLHSGAAEEARLTKAPTRAARGALSSSEPVELLSIDFCKKFISYAKSRVRPVLTEEAREGIAAAFNELRQGMDGRAMPVTARTLETLIRLSTAHAKCRISRTVDAKDVTEAVAILKFAFYAVEEQSAAAPAAAAATAAAGPGASGAAPGGSDGSGGGSGPGPSGGGGGGSSGGARGDTRGPRVGPSGTADAADQRTPERPRPTKRGRSDSPGASQPAASTSTRRSSATPDPEAVGRSSSQARKRLMRRGARDAEQDADSDRSIAEEGSDEDAVDDDDEDFTLGAGLEGASRTTPSSSSSSSSSQTAVRSNRRRTASRERPQAADSDDDAGSDDDDSKNVVAKSRVSSSSPAAASDAAPLVPSLAGFAKLSQSAKDQFAAEAKRRAVPAERVTAMSALLMRKLRLRDAGSHSVDKVLQGVRASDDKVLRDLSEEDLLWTLWRMHSDNKLFLADGEVYLIS